MFEFLIKRNCFKLSFSLTKNFPPPSAQAFPLQLETFNPVIFFARRRHRRAGLEVVRNFTEHPPPSTYLWLGRESFEEK